MKSFMSIQKHVEPTSKGTVMFNKNNVRDDNSD